MAAKSKPENARERKPLTQDRLKELLYYNPDTGVFRWRKTKFTRLMLGDEAGWIKKPDISNNRYRGICVDGKNLSAHRLAWLYAYGEPLPKIIDHVDCDGLNNRINNLRPATNAQNNANNRLRRTSTSGYKGVSWNKRRSKWRALIAVNKKNVHLGYFDIPEEAAKAYGAAARKYYGEYARM